MAAERANVLLMGPHKPLIADGLAAAFTVHTLGDTRDAGAMLSAIAPEVRAVAVSGPPAQVDPALMTRLPRLEIVSSFGVGYDNIDAKWAGEHGIVVTHTPDVLNEEVADTAIGLLLCTARNFPQSDRFVRSGEWARKGFPLSTASLRDRTVGMVGLGRIGKAIARRLDAMMVPVVYHSRRPQADVAYRHYPNLIAMARDVDVLMVITPGGKDTHNLINAAVLDALGRKGILINMARGSVVDEPALIKALREGRIHSAGLDVFVNEPNVPAELIAMDHVVLFPHLGSASVYTRQKMEQLVVDNLLAWNDGKPPLTPVPETPAPPRRR
ncbi:MAG: 2-hydroxyacid dehydrogenase [Proteobacteria bacterium]|nr:2-hydroxyacid dehydrogenase [Pseudomonadota bacterium]